MHSGRISDSWLCVSLQVRWRPSRRALWKSGGTSGLSWSLASSQQFRPVCCCSWAPQTTFGCATLPTSSSEPSTSSWCPSPRECLGGKENFSLVTNLFVHVSTALLWLFYSLCSFQIASSLSKELCALVFGINTFLGTILKSIISLIFSDKRGLGLDVHSQVIYHFILCVIKSCRLQVLHLLGVLYYLPQVFPVCNSFSVCALSDSGPFSFFFFLTVPGLLYLLHPSHCWLLDRCCRGRLLSL